MNACTFRRIPWMRTPNKGKTLSLWLKRIKPLPRFLDDWWNFWKVVGRKFSLTKSIEIKRKFYTNVYQISDRIPWMRTPDREAFGQHSFSPITKLVTIFVRNSWRSCLLSSPTREVGVNALSTRTSLPQFSFEIGDRCGEIWKGKDISATNRCRVNAWRRPSIFFLTRFPWRLGQISNQVRFQNSLVNSTPPRYTSSLRITKGPAKNNDPRTIMTINL